MFKEEKIIADWSADMYEIDETETADVEFLLNCLGTTPKHILEIACGSGRILVPIAKAGHTAVGLDMDEAMLCKIPAKAEGVDNITWRMADAIEDDWGSGYDVIVIAGNFLMNIVSEGNPEHAQMLLMEKAKSALKPGGTLYIDYNYTYYPQNWYIHPGERVIWRGTADGQRIRKEIPSVKHFVSLEQLHTWLEAAGFRIEEEYGDYAGNPIGEATGRAIISATLM